MSGRLRYWQGQVVPWVTLWSDEKVYKRSTLTAQVGGNGLLDPPAGRFGLHWLPQTAALGAGRPPHRRGPLRTYATWPA